MRKYFWLLLFLLLIWPPYSYAKEKTIPQTRIVSWDAVTTYTDESPIMGTVGYKLYYGTLSGTLSKVIDTGTLTRVEVTLPAGEYFFAVTAYDIELHESIKSNEVPGEFIDMVIIVIPKSPTGISCVRKVREIIE